MDRWLSSALDYIPRWIDFQMRLAAQPGCVVAIAERGKLVFEQAFGTANLATGERLTPRHRFRVASHSKSFTAAGILKLRERGKLSLEDRAGRFVAGLHPAAARVTIGQLLSHSGGLIRDGGDDGQYHDRRPFFSARELRAHLAEPPPLEPNVRFKYSNHGYALLGLLIEEAAGEPYREWIAREIVAAAGLRETTPDLPLPRGAKLASGHSARLPLGRRLVIPGDYATDAVAPAGGFVSTAADLARFFAQLAPDARKSVLSAASRREMTRPHWRIPAAAFSQSYGLGTILGTAHGWDWFGHTGSLQGYISRTSVFPRQELAVSVVTNAIDGWAGAWLEGVVAILRGFRERGAPSRRAASWSGRWWSIWGALDLLPMGDKVFAVGPAALDPLLDADEIAPTGRDEGRIAWAEGYNNYGETVTVTRGKDGKIAAVTYAGTRLLPEAKMAREMARRYGLSAGPTRSSASSRRARRPSPAGTA
jgi:CubicO group peptidase (beta-lactamase class C family)